MSHKLPEAYSGAHPVPKVALKSIFDPSGATEMKAKYMKGRDKKEEESNKATENSTSQMQKGKKVVVKDPVTGEETVKRLFQLHVFIY